MSVTKQNPRAGGKPIINRHSPDCLRDMSSGIMVRAAGTHVLLQYHEDHDVVQADVYSHIGLRWP
jgi:hypothetical protein